MPKTVSPQRIQMLVAKLVAEAKRLDDPVVAASTAGEMYRTVSRLEELLSKYLKQHGATPPTSWRVETPPRDVRVIG